MMWAPGLALCALLPLLAEAEYRDLTNITSAVFGSKVANRSFIPAAFGDFNSDRLTDMVVMRDGRRSVEVLLATEQKVVSSGNDPPLFIARADSSLECNAPEGKFVSAVPADFDGDGGMDLMVVTKKAASVKVWILWGNQAALDCKAIMPVELVNRTSNTTIGFTSEPHVMDYNRDYIADLVFVTTEGHRVVVLFSRSRQPPTKQVVLDSCDSKKRCHTDQLKREHSSAFVDLNNDGAADLLLTTQAGLELYQSTGHGLNFHSVVPWPDFGPGTGCTVDKCIGQAIFADCNLDGKLDLLLPICFDPLCSNSSLMQTSLEAMWHQGEHMQWNTMSLELGPFRFLPPDTTESPLRLLAPRLGDVDLDGFPDLLVTVYNTSRNSVPSAGTAETVLLLNTPCGELSACHPYWRQFQAQPGYSRGTGPALAAAFFDLYEDGRLDVLLMEQVLPDQVQVTAWTNTTQNSDAYFIKVIVLSGACYHDCPDHNSQYVPYGTNSGGQSIGYTSQRAGAEVFASYSPVAAQMTQTSHFALQLPYTIFGLGLAPNFVDYMWVNISASAHHTWPQIIPNSQLYVIPYPPDKPEQWDVKLIIFTSKNIVITGLSMIGVCAFVSCVIVALHLRERRQDHQVRGGIGGWEDNGTCCRPSCRRRIDSTLTPCDGQDGA
jgi:integrin alpha FG-GAP repeat containing protein 1